MKQIIQMKHKRLKIPTGGKQTSWLFTSVTQDSNSGHPGHESSALTDTLPPTCPICICLLCPITSHRKSNSNEKQPTGYLLYFQDYHNAFPRLQSLDRQLFQWKIPRVQDNKRTVDRNQNIISLPEADIYGQRWENKRMRASSIFFPS